MQKLYNEINNLKDYTPSKKVNRLFSDLVELALSEKKIKLEKEEINNLQKICANAEYQLEKYWALRIINSEKSQSTLKEFTYYENYCKLTKLEWLAIMSCTKHKKHKILLLGGGPLPLTAIILAKIYKQKITIIEKDKGAVALSKKLIHKLNLQNDINIIHEDAANFENYENFNSIFIAALVGMDHVTKNKILSKIKNCTNKNSHILARSSWGARKILYKPLPKSTYKIFKPILEVKPMNDVVNSFVILENI